MLIGWSASSFVFGPSLGLVRTHALGNRRLLLQAGLYF